MKLHLPSMLRKAVLSCMAAVASLSTTVATGVLTGGVVAWAIAAQQAQATDYKLLEDQTRWALNGTSFDDNGAIKNDGEWGGCKTATYTVPPRSWYTVGADNTLSFSLTYKLSGPNADDNSVQTFAFIDSDKAIVLGTDLFRTDTNGDGALNDDDDGFNGIGYGLSDNVEATAYGSSSGSTAVNLTYFDGATRSTDETTYQMDGKVTYNEASGTYKLLVTLGIGSNTYTSNELDLGSTINISRFVFASEGASRWLTDLTISGALYESPVYTVTLASGTTQATEAAWTSAGADVLYADIDMTGGISVLDLTGAAEGSNLVLGAGEKNVLAVEISGGSVTLSGEGQMTTGELIVKEGATATLATSLTTDSLTLTGGLEIDATATLTVTATDLPYYSGGGYTAPSTPGSDLSFLAQTTGEGTILLTEGGGIAPDMVSEFAGVLEVAAGKMLQLSPGSLKDKSSVDIEEATIRLNEDSNLWIQGHGVKIGAVDVVADSSMRIFDGNENKVATEAGVNIGSLSIAAGKTLLVQKNWEGNVHVGDLNAEGKLDMDHGGSVYFTIEAITASGNIDNAGQTTLGKAGEDSVLNIGGTIANTGTLILADGGVSFSVCDIADFQGVIDYDDSALWDYSTGALSTTGNGFATKSGTMQIFNNTGTIKVGADGAALTDLSSVKVTYRGVETTLTADGKLDGGISDVILGDYVIGGTGENATVALSAINAEAAAGGVEWKKIILRDATTLEVDENATLSVDKLEWAATAKIDVNNGVTVTAGGEGSGAYSANYIANMAGTGTLLVNHDTLIGQSGGTGGIASDFAGTIQVVAGGFLTLGGSNRGYEVDLAEATIELAGGNVNYSSGSGQVKMVHVTETGKFSITEVKQGDGSAGTVQMKEFRVDADKEGQITWVSNGNPYWLGRLNVEALTGEGDLLMHHGYWSAREYEISTIGTAAQSFGDITIARSPGGYKVEGRITLNLGADETSVLNFGNLSNQDAIVNIQGVLAGQSVISGNGTFNFVGDVSVTGDVTMNSTFTQTVGKNLTVDGGALTIAAATTVDTLSVENDGVVSAHAALTISNLSLGSGGALGIDLSKFAADATPITASTYSDALSLKLGGLTAGEYALFQGATSLTLDKVTLLDALTGQELSNTGRATVQASVEDGTGLVKVTVSLSGNLDDLVWETADTDNVWASGGGTNWTSAGAGADQQFYNGDTVAFNGAGEEITISGTVAPASITVNGTGYVFEGTGSIGGSGTITLAEDASLTIATVNTGFTGSTTIAEGSTLTITKAKALGTYNDMTAATVLGKLSGEGTFVINMDNASDILVVKGLAGVGSMENFTGDVVIQRGKLYVGELATESSGNDTAFNVGKITICDGGELWTHFAYGTQGKTQGIKELTADIDMQSGAVLANRDGQMKYSGDIRFNVTADGSGYDATGSVLLTQHWAKTFEYSGLLQGDGTVQFTHPSPENVATYRITGENNTFAGTYELIDYDGNTNTDKVINLRLGSATAAQDADVNLRSTYAKSYLLLDSDATINGLYGVVDAENAVQAQGGNRTLTVTEGDFGGLVMDSGSNVLSLTKQGAVDTTLILRGANSYTGATTINGGTLELAAGAELASELVTVAGGAVLAVNEGIYASTYVDGTGTIEKRAEAALDYVDLAGLADTFAGTIDVQGGNLRLGDTLEIKTGRTLKAGANGVYLNNGLTLSGGKLALDYTTAADAEITMLNLSENALTLLAGNTLSLSGLVLDTQQDNTVDLLTGVGSLLGSDGNALDLTGALASTYFSTIEGLGAGIDTSTLGLQLADGKLQLVVPVQETYLVWGEGTGTWEAGQDFTAEDQDFTAGADVKFGALTAEESETVTISGAVAAGKVLIDGGEGKTYIFVPADDASGIASAESITVNSGTACFWEGSLDMTADTTLAVNDGATLLLNNGAIAHADAVDIVLNDGSTLKWNSDNTTDYSANISLGDAANVTLDVYGNTVSTLSTAVRGAVAGTSITLTDSSITTGETELTVDGGHIFGAAGIVVDDTVQLNLRWTSGGSNGTYANDISGAGDLHVQNGTLILTGSNTLTGELTIGGAKLKVDEESLCGSNIRFTSDAVGGAQFRFSNTGDTAYDFTRVISSDVATGTLPAVYFDQGTVNLSSANTYTGMTHVGESGNAVRVNLSGSLAGGVTVYANNILELATTGAVNGAEGIINNGSVILHKGIDTAVSGTGTVNVDGTGIVWDASGKTYTGTTALQANATVTTASSLTTGANSKITLADGSQLTITGGLDSWTTGHTVSGTGTLVLNTPGELAGGTLAKLITSGENLATLELASGVKLTQNGSAALYDTVRKIVVNSGAELIAQGDLSGNGSLVDNTVELRGGTLKLNNEWFSSGLLITEDSVVDVMAGNTNANFAAGKDAGVVTVSITGEGTEKLTVNQNRTKNFIVSQAISQLGTLEIINVTGATTTLDGAVSNVSTISLSGGTTTINGAVSNVSAISSTGGTTTIKGAISGMQSLTVQSGTTELNTGAFNSTDNKLDIADSITVAAGATLNMKASGNRHTDIVKNDGTNDGGTSQAPTQIVALLSMGDGATLFRDEGVVDLAGGLSVDGSVQLSTNWHKGMDISGRVSGDDQSTINLVRTADRDVQDLLVLKADNSVTFDAQDSTVQTGGFAGTWNVASNYRLRADHENALADATVNLSWTHDTQAARHATLELKASTVNLKALQGVAGTDVKLYTPSPENAENNGAVATTGSTLVISNEATSGNNFAGLLADGVNVKLMSGYQALSGANQSGTHSFTAAGGVLDMTGYARAAVATTADGDEGTATPMPTVYDTIYAVGGQVVGLNLGAGMLLTDVLPDTTVDTSAAATLSKVALGGASSIGAGSLSFRVKDSANLNAGNNNTPYRLTNTQYAVGSESGDTLTLAAIAGRDKTYLQISLLANQDVLDPNPATQGNNYRDHVLISGMSVADTIALSNGTADASGYFAMNLQNVGSTKYNLLFVQNADNNALYDLVLRASGMADKLFWGNAAGGVWNLATGANDWVMGAQDAQGDWQPTAEQADFEQYDYVVFGDLTDAGGAAVESVVVNAGSWQGTDAEGNPVTQYVEIGTMEVNANNTDYTINGTISSAENNEGANLTKTGTGTLTLTGANSYAGHTTITGGTVIAQNEAALSNTQVQIYGAGTWLVFDYDTAAGGDGVFDATVKLDGSGSNPGGSLRALKDAEVNVLITGSNAPKDFHIATGKTLTLNALAADSGATDLGGAFDINQDADGMSGTLKLQLADGRTYNHNKDTQVFAGEYIVSGNADTRLNDQRLFIAEGATARVQGGMTLQVTHLEGPLNAGRGKLVLEDASKLVYAKGSANQSQKLENAIESEGATLQIGGTNAATTTLTLKQGGLTLKGTETDAAADTTLSGGTWVLEQGAVAWDAAATGALAVAANTTVKVNDDTMKKLKVSGNNAKLATAKAGGSAAALSVETITVSDNGTVEGVNLTLTGTGSSIQSATEGIGSVDAVVVDVDDSITMDNTTPVALKILGGVVLDSLTILRGEVKTEGPNWNRKIGGDAIVLNGREAVLNLNSMDKTKNAAGQAPTILIHAGSLKGADEFNGHVIIDDKGVAQTIAMGGLRAAKADVLLRDIETAKGVTTLTGFNGVKLADGSAFDLSDKLAEGKGNLLFSITNPDGDVKADTGATVSIGVNGVLGDVLDAGSVSYTIADKSIAPLERAVAWDATLALYNISATFGTDGKLTLSAVDVPLSPDDIYRSSEDNVGAEGTEWAGNGDNVYSNSEHYASVYIDKDTVIDLTKADAGDGEGLVLSNLIGRGNGANLTITGDGDGKDLVTINNNLEVADVDSNLRSLSFNGDIDVTGTELQLLNTVATPGAQDAGELDTDSVYQINGALTADADSPVTITSGILKLNGKGSNASELLGGVTVENETGWLQVSGEASIGGTLQVSDELGVLDMTGDLELLSGGKVTLLDGAVVDNGFGIKGAGEGKETLSIAKGATATLSEVSHVQDVVLELQEGSTLVMNVDENTNKYGPAVDVDGLTGTGTLQGSSSAAGYWPQVHITPQQDCTFSGDLSDYEGFIHVHPGKGTQTFDKVTTVADSEVELELEGKSVINVAEENGNKTLNLRVLKLLDGSDTTVEMNTDSGAPAIRINRSSATMKDGAALTLSSAAGEVLSADDDLLFMEGTGQLSDLDGKSITLDITDNAFRRLSETAKLVVKGDKVYVDLAASETNRYEEGASDPNAKAGAELLWNVDPSKLPADSALKAIDNAVAELMQNGNRDAAERALAATAGAGTAVLGSAFSADVERQLRAIRNRTTTMGVNQCEVNEGMPYVNAWINAEGDHREMDADGLAAGYTMDSWGGTVGFDVDITNNLTMGMAVTAMYGDLEADSADRAEGDFDTQYVSLFARVAHQAWTHTFVATLGRADVTLNRTVSVPGGSYETSGDTDGMAYGFMYEVARTFSLNEDGTTCWQPVFNVAWRHSSIDAYTESGADNALAVGEQDMNVLTFGAGARLQTVMGESLYNRASIFEARAMVKVDAGDREGEADVALLEGTTAASVKSAEIGAVGVEIGAGVTIPVGLNAGSIFIDGSAEFRSGYSNVNGTVGYRINF